MIEELADYVDGNEIKTFEYDNAGRLAAVVLPQVPDPENNNELTNPRYRYYYDIYGNLIATLDPKGRVTRFTYNELNQQVKSFMPFAASLPDEPNVSDILDLDLSGIDFEQKDYDALSRLVKATDFKGQITGYFYNNRGLLEYEQYYHSDANYPAVPDKIIQYTYDNLGRKRQVFVDTQLEQEFDYDAEGLIRFISSPQGDIGYDYSLITGRKEFVCTPTDCDDTEIEYTYDILGRLAEVIVHKRNGQSASETTTYWYNPSGSIEKIEYPNGNTAEYSYDALNRLKNLVNKDASEETLSSYTYELYADGMRSSVTEVDGTIIWNYDNLNRLIQEEDVGVYTDKYVYDLVGNRKCIKDADDVVLVEYSYNDLDQLEFEDYTSDQDYTYEYDENGSLTRKYYGTGSIDLLAQACSREADVSSLHRPEARGDWDACTRKFVLCCGNVPSPSLHRCIG